MPQQNKQTTQSQPQAQPQPQVELMGQLKEQLLEELKREIKDELKKELKKEILVEKKTNKQPDCGKQTQFPELEEESQKKTDQQAKKEKQKEIKKELKKELKKEIVSEKQTEAVEEQQQQQQQQQSNKLDEFMATLIEKLNKQIKVDKWAMVASNKQVRVKEDLFDKMTKRILEEFVLKKKKEPLGPEPKSGALSERVRQLQEEINAIGKRKEFKEAQFEKILAGKINEMKAIAKQSQSQGQSQSQSQKESPTGNNGQKENQIDKKKDKDKEKEKEKWPLIDYSKSLQMSSHEQEKLAKNLNDFKEFSKRITQSMAERESRPDCLKDLQLQKKAQMQNLTKDFRTAISLGKKHRKQIREEKQDKQDKQDKKQATKQPIPDRKSQEDGTLGEKINEFKAALDSLGQSINQIKQKLISETKQAQAQAQTQTQPKEDPPINDGQKPAKQEKDATTGVEQAEQKDMSQQAMQQRKAELQNATMADNIHAMVFKVSEKCFRNCVNSYTTSLEAQERSCINDCMSTYIDSYRLVNRAFVKRIHSEHRKRSEQREQQQREPKK